MLNAVIECGSNNKASKKLGTSRRNVDIMLKRLEARAAGQGIAPHRDLTHQTAEGFEAKRISTAYKEDGSQALQWVIQEKSKGLNLDQMVQAIEGFEWKPAPKIKAPKGHDSELLTLYTLTDFHLGMYSWAAETGNDWDMSIAEHEAMSAMGWPAASYSDL